MDMIERAARALAEVDDVGANRYRNMVRTVISALREPDEGMIEAGSAAIQSSGFVDDATKLGWQAMIDQALKG